MAGRLSLLRRLTADVRALDAVALQADTKDEDATAIEALNRGVVVSIVGRLRTVVYTPRETVPTLSAELFDGTGTIDLVWLGRRRIAGINPGRRVWVRGRVGVHNGRLAIYNPCYELRPAQ